ncbi:MAG TPA: hypothetical protein VFJ94_08605, partial [Intrasporangium sp.]|uniref:hypothetical protein n=1 Tax=Intrasporangium sp. TaxID=1925024 RepID=UPI002D76BA82
MSHHPTRPAAGGWLGRLAAPVAVGVVLVAAVGIRVAALPFESPDYRFYLSKWYAHLQQQGFTGFAQAFAEYNPPYLYLLYLVSLLGPPAIVAVKVVSALGDLSLAVGVLAVVRQAGRSRRVAVAAALTVLVVPTVVLNSAFWGQCDALHTSLLLWTLVLL